MPICFSVFEQKVTIVLPQRDFRWNEAFEVTKSEKLRETNSPLGLDAFQLDSKMCLRNVQMNIKILRGTLPVAWMVSYMGFTCRQ